jgi:hypothetical protein
MIEGVPVLGVMSAQRGRQGPMRRLPPFRRSPTPPQLTLEPGVQ